MLLVFSILEYRMDDRNSSARPTVRPVRPQSLYCMCSLHSRHFIATLNLISCSFKQSTDAKLIQGDTTECFVEVPENCILI